MGSFRYMKVNFYFKVMSIFWKLFVIDVFSVSRKWSLRDTELTFKWAAASTFVYDIRCMYNRKTEIYIQQCWPKKKKRDPTEVLTNRKASYSLQTFITCFKHCFSRTLVGSVAHRLNSRRNEKRHKRDGDRKSCVLCAIPLFP